MSVAVALFALQGAPAGAAGDAGIERMALCRDSWLDWQKAGDAKLQQFAAHFRSAYAAKGNDPYVVPKAETQVAGFRLLQVYPQSVGMGVGFSVLVDAPFDKVRKRVERTLGRPLPHCETGDGMQSCELPIAEKRTLTLMTQDGRSTLIACYYYYER
ncbi:MAG TPA: hypothetical protein VGB91_06410 [Rhizomicrobium sp.]